MDDHLPTQKIAARSDPGSLIAPLWSKLVPLSVGLASFIVDQGPWIGSHFYGIVGIKASLAIDNDAIWFARDESRLRIVAG